MNRTPFTVQTGCVDTLPRAWRMLINYWSISRTTNLHSYDVRGYLQYAVSELFEGRQMTAAGMAVGTLGKSTRRQTLGPE